MLKVMEIGFIPLVKCDDTIQGYQTYCGLICKEESNQSAQIRLDISAIL